jgi:hypothetical protein
MQAAVAEVDLLSEAEHLEQAVKVAEVMEQYHQGTQQQEQ